MQYQPNISSKHMQYQPNISTTSSPDLISPLFLGLAKVATFLEWCNWRVHTLSNDVTPKHCLVIHTSVSYIIRKVHRKCKTNSKSEFIIEFKYQPKAVPAFTVSSLDYAVSISKLLSCKFRYI